ncbi:MAG: carboxyl-terminal processing protease CtpB [Cyanobacteria bacterium P01_A01_bin.123]
MNQALSFLNLSKLCFVGGAIATTLLTPLSLTFSEPVAAAWEDSPKAVLDEAWQIVNRDYVDSEFNHVDWQAMRQSLLSRDYTSREAAYGALRQALRRLDDPYTRFLDPQQYAALTDQTAGEVSGVGIRLQRDSNSRMVVIVETFEDSPAAEAGIQAGDRLLMVDGQSTDLLTIEAISQLIRGTEGSQVTLTIGNSDDGQRRTVIVTRGLIELATVSYDIKEQNGTTLGYIRLSEFSAHAAEQMEKAIEELTKAEVEAFVLDLRGNPGGLLQASIEISRMWLQRGPIVRTVDRSGDSEEISANRTALTQLPLAVLVDNRSASSSEILTGALRDNGRATVVGSTTYGKALVQALHNLSDGSGLAVTIAHYYTPNGTDISSKGITPDIQINLTAGERRQLLGNPQLIATEADPQYARAAALLEETVLAQREDSNVAIPTSTEVPQVGQGIDL